MRYALIDGGVILDVIVADEAFAASIASEWDDVRSLEGVEAGIGWAVDGDGFAPPEQPPKPEQPAAPRHISVGAFFDRFGPLKWAILADGNPQVQAVVKDASVRDYIDLDNTDLPAGLALLQAAGHAIDPEVVVEAPIRPEELP